jgi:hypothetical protein
MNGNILILPQRFAPKTDNLSKPKNICNLNNFINKKLKEIGKKYDYRYSVLILVFARLISDGWLDYNDLKGVAENKIDRIKSIIRFCWNE